MAASYSYSQLKTYQTCPACWAYQKKEKLPAVRGILGEQGIELHEAINRYINHLAKEKLISDITWSKLCDGLDLYPDGNELIQKFASSFVFNPATHIGSEMEIAIDKTGKKVGWWDKNIWFRAKIDKLDLVDRVLHITDYKTGWSTDVDKFQLQCYTWVMGFSGLKVEYDSFYVNNHFIRHRVEKGEAFPKGIGKATGERIKRIIKQIEADKKYEAKPGNFCSMCGYVNQCSKLIQLVEKGQLPIIDTPELAFEYTRRVLIVKEMVKNVEGILKIWIKANGNIELDNVIYGFNASPSKQVIDKELLYDKICEMELNPLDFVNFDMKKLKKLKLQNVMKDINKVKFGTAKKK